MTSGARLLGLGLIVACSLVGCGRKGEPLTPEPRSVEAEVEAAAKEAAEEAKTVAAE